MSLGVVAKVHVSLDELVKSADIKTSRGILPRPVNKLVLLVDMKLSLICVETMVVLRWRM